MIGCKMWEACSAWCSTRRASILLAVAHGSRTVAMCKANRSSFRLFWILVCGGGVGSACVIWVVSDWDVCTGKQLCVLEAGASYANEWRPDVGSVRGVAFDSGGKHLACGGTWPKNGGHVQGKPIVV